MISIPGFIFGFPDLLASCVTKKISLKSLINSEWKTVRRIQFISKASITIEKVIALLVPYPNSKGSSSFLH